MSTRNRVVLCACWSLGFASLALAVPPASYFKPGVPDFDQKDPALPDGGNFHCSPTSMADSLTWFDNNGYNVVPDAWNGTTGGNHVPFVNHLGGLAKTNKGTWNDNAVRGLREYLSGPNNQSGHRWDVKFQGTKYFNGYTVGQNSPNVSGDWFRQELADKEDVMFSIDWYYETAPGVLSAQAGAHQIVLDGYTAGGDLLIRDPFYAEGIVERDASFPNRLIYEYSTGNDARLRAEIVSVISVSPKEHLFLDGLYHFPEYLIPLTPTPSYGGGKSIYGDYVSLAIQDKLQVTPFTGKTLHFYQQGTNTGFFDVIFTSDETFSILLRHPNAPVWLSQENMIDLEVALNPQTNSYEYELFLNRELFGLLEGTAGVDLVLGSDLLTSFDLSAQLFGSPTLIQGGTPDFTFDPLYPLGSTDPLVLQLEQITRLQAIGLVPEPALGAGLLLCALATRRRYAHG